MPDDRRGTDPAGQFLVVEALVIAGLAALFIIVTVDDEVVPGVIGLALSLVLLSLVAWRAARRRKRP